MVDPPAVRDRALGAVGVQRQRRHLHLHRPLGEPGDEQHHVHRLQHLVLHRGREPSVGPDHVADGAELLLEPQVAPRVAAQEGVSLLGRLLL